MTCQECELALGNDQNVDEHLAVCASCRALAEEMRANTAAFEALSADPLPGVRYKVMAQVRSRSAARQVLRWGWAVGALAAAAMLVMLLRQPKPAPTVKSSPAVASVVIPQTQSPAPVERIPVRRLHRQTQEILKVKMLTADPNVVIYWLVENKERTE